MLVNLFVIMLYNYNVKKIALNFITTGMAVLVAISLFSYILFLLNLYPVSPSDITSVASDYIALNYYTFIVGNQFQYDFYRRFCCIFAEPGHLAMGLVLLLAAHKFQLSKISNLILFLGVLFSFSLAGYITTFLGILLYNISIKKVYNVVLLVFFVFAGFFIIENTNSSKILDVYLWNRIDKTDESSFKIKDNRTSYFYNQEFERTINNPETFIFGQDEKIKDYTGGNAGYKVFIVKNGLLGILLVFIFFTRNMFVYRKKEYVFFTLILSLLLIQGFQPFWECVIFTYILSHFDFSDETHSLLNGEIHCPRRC